MDIEALEQAVAVSPDNIPLCLLLADAYLGAFSIDEAVIKFEHVISLEPKNAAAKVGLAQALELSGKTSEAILRLEQVCEDTPDHAPAWIQRAKFALSEGEAQEARKFYDRGVEISPQAADKDLLQRIVEAGGKDDAPKVTVQGGDGWGAAAFLSEDEDDDCDGRRPENPFGDDIGLEFLEKPKIDFSKVGGMGEVKKNIQMKILHPLNNKELFELYGKKAGGGVLLYGPPGCGKTLISRATAGEIDANFLSVGLHQILDMWIGGSEQKLHQIFEFARQHAPAVLFFDEVDALAADRKDMRTSAGRTVINQFLAELDGNIDENDGVLVLGATNAPWHLDSAFLRPGRFDRLIFVPPPDLEARAEIIRIMAEGKPISDLNPESLAKRLKDFSGADISAVFDQAIEATLEKAMAAGKPIPVSGKLLAKMGNIVKPSTRRWFESAKNYALYANQSGFYDEVLEHLGLKKP
ncbi:MAG: transitional endoplasmic reticulum ATPase [Verrucomicrobiales bacterium]|jgi:transitional endoplasmic reticulum ATPase